MTPSTNLSAEWEKMSEQEKIEFLATKVMGWEKRDSTAAPLSWYEAESGRWAISVRAWNPIANWNHWREVEEKALASESQLWRYYSFEMSQDCDRKIPFAVDRALANDIPRRAKCLYLAFNSLS